MKKKKTKKKTKRYSLNLTSYPSGAATLGLRARQEDPYSQSVTFYGSLINPQNKTEALVINSIVLFSGRNSEKNNLYEYRLIDEVFIDAIECPMVIEYLSPGGEKRFLDCIHKDVHLVICKPLDNLEYMNRMKKKNGTV